MYWKVLGVSVQFEDDFMSCHGVLVVTHSYTIKIFLKTIYKFRIALVDHRLRGPKPQRRPRPLLKPSSEGGSVRLVGLSLIHI